MTAATERRTILSFYCDDTSPSPAGAFRTFLDYCSAHGVKGESSVILGGQGSSLARDKGADAREYLDQVRRAWDCGIDSHMELMTHGGRFDFAGNREPEGAGHEGLWLYEPAVGVEEYEAYLGGILDEGDRAGIRFTGLTWPGCSCPVCDRRYEELRAAAPVFAGIGGWRSAASSALRRLGVRGPLAPNPNLWKALLNLAARGRFRGPVIPCFFDSSETRFGMNRKAAAGPAAVFDFMPNAMDWFGSWGNGQAYVNPDYYITADGKSGIIPKRVAAGDPYCLFYAHWQGLNPADGVGWKAFTAVVERVEARLRDRIVWMRPSDVAAAYHRAGDWSFRKPG